MNAEQVRLREALRVLKGARSEFLSVWLQQLPQLSDYARDIFTNELQLLMEEFCNQVPSPADRTLDARAIEEDRS